MPLIVFLIYFKICLFITQGQHESRCSSYARVSGFKYSKLLFGICLPDLNWNIPARYGSLDLKLEYACQI